MSDSVELKPCPFCGGEAEIERYGTPRQSTIVCCTDCGCTIEGPEEFAHGRQWNTRATDPLLDEMAEALKAMLARESASGRSFCKPCDEVVSAQEAMKKYREHQSLANPNPQPPQP